MVDSQVDWSWSDYGNEVVQRLVETEDDRLFQPDAATPATGGRDVDQLGAADGHRRRGNCRRRGDDGNGHLRFASSQQATDQGEEERRHCNPREWHLGNRANSKVGDRTEGQQLGATSFIRQPPS